MLVFLGLVLFLAGAAAVAAAVRGAVATVSFDALGRHYSGVDVRWVFAAGAAAGLALAVGAWMLRRGARRQMTTWREHRRVRRSEAELRAENERLTAELERTRTADPTYPAYPADAAETAAVPDGRRPGRPGTLGEPWRRAGREHDA